MLEWRGIKKTLEGRHWKTNTYYFHAQVYQQPDLCQKPLNFKKLKSYRPCNCTTKEMMKISNIEIQKWQPIHLQIKIHL